LAVLTKHRIYIESTIIGDWLLVETFPKNRLNKLTPEVHASHKLFEFLLQRKNDEILPFTSYWAIFEAVGVIKRSNIETWLVLDGLSSRYYQELKNDPKYRLQPFQIKKINALVNKLVSEGKSSKIRLLPEQSDIKNGVSLMLERNLEAPDSLHLGIALTCGCNFFVTKDHHYDGCVEPFKDQITILKPTKMIEILINEGFMSGRISDLVPLNHF